MPDTPVEAGNSTTFGVQFTSTTYGFHNATIMIENNDDGQSPYTFGIGAHVLPPDIDVSGNPVMRFY